MRTHGTEGRAGNGSVIVEEKRWRRNDRLETLREKC